MKLTIQRMARIAILSALAVGLRSAFIGLPNIQPITAMFFVAVLYLGLVDGLLIMALTMSISGFIFGFGPWIFNQILAFGVLMALWSLIAPRLSLVWQIALVTLLSFLYGVLMDYSYGLLFKSGLTFVISGLLYDTYHAVSTLLFYPFIQSIFRRFNRKRFSQWLDYVALAVTNIRSVLAGDVIISGEAAQYLDDDDMAGLRERVVEHTPFGTTDFTLRKGMALDHQDIIGAALRFVEPYVRELCDM